MTARISVFHRILLAVVLTASSLAAQRPPLTAEWIVKEGEHVAEVPHVAWLNNGSAILYDVRQPEASRTFEQLDPASGRRKPILDMAKAMASLKSLLAADEAKDLKAALPWPEGFDLNGSKAVYIFAEDVFLLDIPTFTFSRVTQSKAEEKDPQFSPDGKMISFVRENDIYAYDIAGKKETRLTSDGSQTTLNGTLSWVYWEEIFGRKDTGYWWSPDSQSIAYLQTDESAVPVSTFVDFQPVDTRIVTQRYPKAGETNPKLRVGVVRIGQPATHWISVTDKPFEWILRVKWLPDSRQVSLEALNRAQTELGLYFADAESGTAKRILTETDSAWINDNDDLYFLKDGQFFWASERDGYMHLYRYKMDGTLVNQVTKGDWAIISSGGLAFWVHQAVVGIDEKNDWIYFTTLKDNSVERQLYRIKSDGSGMTRLSTEAGTHRILMSPDTKYYFDTYSNIRTLPSLGMHTSDGKLADMIAQPRPELLADNMQYAELLRIPATDGFPMPAQILKPANFDPSRKYPVILFVYGGPSAPMVHNSWEGQTLFDNLMANLGYVMVSIDNRCATAISKKLENTLAANPAVSETEDLVAGVRWLKAQPWVDGSRVGVYGWSGGGTNTLNLMTRSTEFKAGIAGAPVTDWHYYDSKWTEALVKLPQDRPEIYDRTSLVKRADKLSGRLLLMYGTYDDNVHPQNEEAFENALIKAGKPYKVVIYPMRKHGFVDDPAKIHRMEAMVEFWKENL